MWDKKRQLIWIVGGVLMGTFVAYSNAFTDEREFSIKFFVFMEKRFAFGSVHEELRNLCI